MNFTEHKAPEFTEEKFEELNAAITDLNKCRGMDYFGTFRRKNREYDVWLKFFGKDDRELFISSDISGTDDFNSKAEYSCTITSTHLDLQDGYKPFKLFIQDMIDEMLENRK